METADGGFRSVGTEKQAAGWGDLHIRFGLGPRMAGMWFVNRWLPKTEGMRVDRCPSPIRPGVQDRGA
jgi:hypothetical protein